MKDFNYPDREWARVTEDQAAEITFFDVMTTTLESFCSEVADHLY